jgi:hypothetical protein
VGAAFDDLSFAHDEDAIAIDNRLQTMGHENDCA